MNAYLSLESYDKVEDYKKLKVSTQKKITISRVELKRYILTMGGYGGHVVSASGQSFYMSAIDLALKQTDNWKDCYYYMSEDYSYAEPTFKVMISFLMGMVAAKMISERVYQIPLLYHLTDKKRVTYKTSSGKSAPDFLGLRYDKKTRRHIPYLFEAKGQSQNDYVAHTTVKTAKDQLKNIRSVTVYGIGATGVRTFPKNSIEKHVATSSFKIGSSQTERKWIVCDIDPKEVEGDGELQADADQETKAYYDQLLSIMKSAEYQDNLYHNDYITESIDNKSYILIEHNGEYFGVQKEIYRVLTAFGNIGSTRGLYSEILPILQENKTISKDTHSIGLDGVIYIGRN